MNPFNELIKMTGPFKLFVGGLLLGWGAVLFLKVTFFLPPPGPNILVRVVYFTFFGVILLFTLRAFG